MKAKHTKMRLTFGKFVASVYNTCGKQKAGATVQRAVNSHLVQFLGRRHFLIC